MPYTIFNLRQVNAAREDPSPFNTDPRHVRDTQMAGPNTGARAPIGVGPWFPFHTYRDRTPSITSSSSSAASTITTTSHPTSGDTSQAGVSWWRWTASSETLSDVNSQFSEASADVDYFGPLGPLAWDETDSEADYDDYAEAADSASDASNCGEDDENICQLCCRRVAVIAFDGCTHKACPACVRGTWWGRIDREGCWPEWIPCWGCRREVKVLVIGKEAERKVTLLDWLFEVSNSIKRKLAWEVIDAVAPTSIQVYLVRKHREIFLPGIGPLPRVHGSDALTHLLGI